MIKNGDKNVNVVAIIDKLSGKPNPYSITETKVDEYKDTDYSQYPRDFREHNPINVINSEKVKPTNDGIDEYKENEVHFQFPRDPREHNPLEVINSDETKPLDRDDNMHILNKILNSTTI